MVVAFIKCMHIVKSSSNSRNVKIYIIVLPFASKGMIFLASITEIEKKTLYCIINDKLKRQSIIYNPETQTKGEQHGPRPKTCDEPRCLRRKGTHT